MKWREVFIQYAMHVNEEEGTDFLGTFIWDGVPAEDVDELRLAIDEMIERNRIERDRVHGCLPSMGSRKT